MHMIPDCTHERVSNLASDETEDCAVGLSIAWWQSTEGNLLNATVCSRDLIDS